MASVLRKVPAILVAPTLLMACLMRPVEFYTKDDGLPPIGAKVQVRLHDGSRVKGVCKEIRRLSDQDYGAAYAAARAKKPEAILLPALGESILVVLKPLKDFRENDSERVILRGFDLDRITVYARGEVRQVYMGPLLKIVDAAYNDIDAKALRQLLASGAIPLQTKSLLLEGEAGSTEVSVAQIDQIWF